MTTNTANAFHWPVRSRLAVLWRNVPETQKYYRQTLFVSGALLLFVTLFYAIEKYLLGLDNAHRMWRDSADMVMRLFGFSHYLVAIIFMLSSRRMQTARSWLWFGGLLAVSVLMVGVARAAGGIYNPVILLLIYFYFLVHDFRDQTHFYLASPDCPRNNPEQTARLLQSLQWMLLTLLFALVVPTGVQYLILFDNYPADDPVLAHFFPASVPFLVKFAVCLVPAMLVNLVIARRVARQYPGGWQQIWQEHGPILRVFRAYSIFVLLSLVVGPAIFVFVVLAHFVGWFLFADRKLRAAPARPESENLSRFAWMRRTVAGFRTLHLGTAALFAVVVAVAIYGFGTSSPQAALFGKSAFYYLTIAHITLSFLPR